MFPSLQRLTMATLMLGGVTAAHAQRSRGPVPSTQGFSLGAHTVVASGVTIAGPNVPGEIRTHLGEGGGLQVSYGFTPNLAVFASVDLAKQGTDVGNLDGSMGLVNVEVGGRVAFPTTRSRMVPYLMGVVGSRGLAARSTGGDLDLTMRLTGSEIGVGGGFLYAFARGLSLDAGVIATRGKFGRMKITGDANQEADIDPDPSTNFRLKVGFQWHP